MTLPVVDLPSEASIARGVALGRATRHEVTRSLDTYRTVLPAATGRSWTELRSSALPIIDAARALDAPLVDDLTGLALGARVELDDIQVLAARSELMQLAPAHPPVGECTTVALDGRIGQTWDWFVGQLGACVVWRTPRFLAFAEAGMPPKIGVNSDGVAVTLNFLSTRLPVDPEGVPVHAALHHLLERATSTPDAVDRLLDLPVAGSAAVGVLDADGRAAMVELAAHGRTAEAPAARPLLHTNHCLSDPLTGSDVPGMLLDSSVARLARARALVDRGAAIDQVLGDDRGPHPIALAPIGPLGTVAAVVIDVQARTLTIAPGNPAQVGFTQTVHLPGATNALAR